MTIINADCTVVRAREEVGNRLGSNESVKGEWDLADSPKTTNGL